VRPTARPCPADSLEVLEVLEVLDEARRQLGVRYLADEEN
jgi:hypothetical protein